MNHVQKKLKHLKKFGFLKQQLHEIKKMYEGKPFDASDAAYLRLLDVSKMLCEKYREVCQQELLLRRKNKKLKLSIFKFLRFYFRKLRVLKLLFPIHGFILYAESGISAVIGLVDLKGYGFINQNVVFSPNALVKVKKGVVFASNITVGAKEKFVDGKKVLQQIEIEENSWICAGVKISGDVKLGKACVVGGGAFVQTDIAGQMLAVGRPCKEIKKIEKTATRQPAHLQFSFQQKNTILQHIKMHNFGKIPKAFETVIEGKVFSSMDASLGFLYRLTKWLCFEYSCPQTTQARKQEILNVLFAGHGKNLQVEGGFQLDLLGTVLLGDNVKIGKNALLGGNIVVGDGVEIGDDVCMFASGHSLIAKERMMKFSLKRGFYEETQYDFIQVQPNIKIGNNVVVVPNSTITENVEDNALFVRGKTIKNA